MNVVIRYICVYVVPPPFPQNSENERVVVVVESAGRVGSVRME